MKVVIFESWMRFNARVAELADALDLESSALKA